MIGYLAMVDHARFYRYPVSMLEGIASAANSLTVCEDPKLRGLKIGRVQFKNGRGHLIYQLFVQTKKHRGSRLVLRVCKCRAFILEEATLAMAMDRA